MTAETLPTRADLFFAPARIGRSTVSYDRDSQTYTISTPGHALRSTRRFSRALDIAVGLA